MITIIVMIIAIIIIFSIKFTDKSDKELAGKVSISCNLDNKEYTYEVEYNKDYQYGRRWFLYSSYRRLF